MRPNAALRGALGRVGLLSAFGASACGVGVPAPPAPVTPPVLGDVALDFGDEPGGVFFTDPGPASRDEILSSPMIRDPEFQREVERWVTFWRTSGSRWFPEYLARMEVFGPTVDAALEAEQIPASLRYLPIIESGYSPRAVSRARAVGLWQFMAPTARGYGMDVGPLFDQRRDPFKSTVAAADFLGRLRVRFGSWFLALAAYNAGPNRLQRILDRYAPLAPRSDSLYWALRPRLPRETRDFVPKFFGAIAVAQNPGAHGIEVPEAGAGFAFDEVTVPDATTLDVVAEAAEAPQTEIERLNPEVVRGITPPGRTTRLRVPPGRGTTFSERYAQIPPSERVTFVEHRIVRGETFSHVAVRYGVPLSDLRAANPGTDPRRLQIGQRITVPVAPKAPRR